MPGGRLRCGDRPRHRFFHSCIPVAEFGSSWPDGVPVQVHGMDADSFFVDDGDLAAARALVDEAADAEASALLTERVLDFLHAR